jgi:fumarate reductase subunit C
VNARAETWLWIAQRATAAILAIAVLIHIATIFYAVRVGLSASAILARLHGNIAWYGFYLVFATVAAIHASIGLRVILREHTGWKGPVLDAAMLLFGVVLAVTGCRAAGALFA